MSRSLQRHLSAVVTGTILVTGLLATLTSFALAYFEATEFQDDLLLQVATLSGGSSGTASPAHANGGADTARDDAESRITVFHLPDDFQPSWLPDDLAPGFHTRSTETGTMRVFVREQPSNSRTVVTQPTHSRDEIAIDSALHTLVPLLCFIPLLVWLIVRIIRSELAPIVRLANSLDEQPAERPQPIASDGVPSEILPFIQASNRLLTRVNLLMEQQRRFIADAAHELRSPLTALSVQAQNLLHADSIGAMQERAAPLLAGIERARRLTEQMLNFARTQVDPPTDTPVDLSGLAREVIAQFLPAAEARNIDLVLEEREPIMLRAAQEPMQLIVKNALENAIKYSPAGTEVTLRLREEDDSVIVEIIDRGPGIPPVDRERVFEAFYRRPGSSGDGSGLGLAITREAAARLGGTVSLHAAATGTGLIFRYRQSRGR